MFNKLLSMLLAGIGLGAAGLVSVWAHQPILAPSLGSAIFIQALTPEQPTARIWNMAVGQLLGVAGGFFGVYIGHAVHDPTFMYHHMLAYTRVGAVILAALVTAGLQLLFKAINPAGGATAVILAVGAETANWPGALRLAGGIAVITLVGEIGRRCVLLRR